MGIPITRSALKKRISRNEYTDLRAVENIIEAFAGIGRRVVSLKHR
jgi:hypothetical protein